MRKLAVHLLGCAALGCLVAAPAQADAQPFSATFDHGALELGATRGMYFGPFGETPPTASLEGEIEDDGTFSVPADGFTFPTQSLDVVGGNPVEVGLVAAAESTGSYDSATGALDLSIPLSVAVTWDLGSCTFSPLPATLSTNSVTPAFDGFPGVPFAAGLDGTGAITGSWSDLPEGVGDDAACDLAENAVGGRGGMVLSNQIEYPPPHVDPPRLIIAVTPARRSTRSRSVQFVTRVTNVGFASAQSARVCVRTPTALRGFGRRCRTIGAIQPGDSASRIFWLKPRRSARRGIKRVRFTVSAVGLDERFATATIRVLRPKSQARRQ